MRAGLLAAALALTAAVGIQAQQPDAGASWHHLSGYDLAIGGNQTIQWFWDTYGLPFYRIINNRYQNGVYVGNDVDVVVNSPLCDTWNIHQNGTGGWSYLELRNNAIWQNSGDVWKDDYNGGAATYGSYYGCAGFINNSSNSGQGLLTTNGPQGGAWITGGYGQSWINTSALNWGNVCAPTGVNPAWNCWYGPAWAQRFHYWT